jgi:transposase-like protein
MEKERLRELVERFGRFVPEADRALAEAWLAGESQSAIARRHGAAQASVSCRLRRLGERLAHVRSCRLPDFTEQDFLENLVPPLGRREAEMLSAYYGGNSQSEVARRYGLGHQTRFRAVLRKSLRTLDETGSAPEYARALRTYWRNAPKIAGMAMRDWNG